jgi:hypothetical protein
LLHELLGYEHPAISNPQVRAFVWERAKENYCKKGIRVFCLDEPSPNTLSTIFGGCLHETESIWFRLVEPYHPSRGLHRDQPHTFRYDASIVGGLHRAGLSGGYR